jgi:hypothetical protein
VERGFRKRDTLSTVLFNIIWEKVISHIESNPNGIIFNRTRQCMVHSYTDDVVMLGPCMNETEEVLAQLKSEAEFECGLPSI